MLIDRTQTFEEKGNWIFSSEREMEFYFFSARLIFKRREGRLAFAIETKIRRGVDPGPQTPIQVSPGPSAKGVITRPFASAISISPSQSHSIGYQQSL